MKPLLDSYYAPYRIHTRYWTGFLLLVRCSLYIAFSLEARTKSLLAIIIAFTAVIAWLSVKIYTKFYTNAIEAFVYFNLIVLSAADLAGVNSPALANSLVGIVFSIMMGIIVYHFHVLYIAKSTTWLKMLSLITGPMKNRGATEGTPLLAPVPQRPVVTRSFVSLREPMLTDN